MTHWPFIFLVSRQQGESSIEGTPGAQQGEPCENDERLPGYQGGTQNMGFNTNTKILEWILDDLRPPLA